MKISRPFWEVGFKKKFPKKKTRALLVDFYKNLNPVAEKGR